MIATANVEDLAELEEATGFEQFVHTKGKALWRAAWMLTGDAHHADDLVQTALAKTWGRYDSIGNDHQFEAYVRTTIYRTYVSWWRKMSWRNETPAEHLREDATRPGDDGIRLDIRRALDELPRMQKAVMVLQYFEDLSVDEIASRLGISTGTVKTHASRARAAMQQSTHLAQEGV